MLWLLHHGGGGHGEVQLAPVHDNNQISPAYVLFQLAISQDIKGYTRRKQVAYIWLSRCVNMFLTPCASEKQLPSHELATQTNIQSYFWIIHMKACKTNLYKNCLYSTEFNKDFWKFSAGIGLT